MLQRGWEDPGEQSVRWSNSAQSDHDDDSGGQPGGSANRRGYF